MLFSKNDVILQSEGRGGQKKAKKIAVILNVWPLSTAFSRDLLVVRNQCLFEEKGGRK